MAKKRIATRRVPSSGTPRIFGDGQPSSVAQRAAAVQRAAAAPRQAPATVTPRRPAPHLRHAEARSQVPLPIEYRHVGGDLRQLGVLSVITFAVMIVLGIVIR